MVRDPTRQIHTVFWTHGKRPNKPDTHSDLDTWQETQQARYTVLWTHGKRPNKPDTHSALDTW